jgi:pyrimidine deaminase RibD-like protein
MQHPEIKGIGTIRRDQIEPVGTIVLLAFRITGYKEDHGVLTAHLEQIESETTGKKFIDSDLVVTLEELQAMFFKGKPR